MDGPFRMPVQAVFKFTNDGDDRRIVAGTIDSGRVRVGDEVVFHPSGKRTRVKSLESFNRVAPSVAGAGESAGFTLAQQIYVTRGELATLAHEPQPVTATRIRASIFWLGTRPLEVGRNYALKLGTARVSVHLEHIERVLDASTLESVTDRTSVVRNEVADCVLKLRHPIAFDRASELAATSRFVLVDNFSISGGGVVRDALPTVERRAPSAGTAARSRCGPACCGSPASAVRARPPSRAGSPATRTARARGSRSSTTTPSGRCFRPADRGPSRIFACVGSRGLPPDSRRTAPRSSSPSTPRKRTRAASRRTVASDFVEIHLHAAPDVLASRGGARDLVAFEAPVQPELRLDTGRLSLDEAGAEVIAWLREWSTQS